MTSNALQPKHRGSRDTLALVRLVLIWLLVTVLAVDLVTSPLHAHRHDGEWSVSGTVGVSSEHVDILSDPGSADGITHVDHDDAPGFSHSIVALRTLVELKADVQPSDDTTAAAPWYVSATWLPAEVAPPVWPPDRHRAGSNPFRSLPPEGRAPPVHA